MNITNGLRAGAPPETDQKKEIVAKKGKLLRMADAPKGRLLSIQALP